jgi:hypothetical protein
MQELSNDENNVKMWSIPDVCVIWLDVGLAHMVLEKLQFMVGQKWW